MGSLFSAPKPQKPDQSLIDAQKRRETSLAKQEADQNTQLESRKRAARALKGGYSATLFEQTGVTGVKSATLGG